MDNSSLSIRALLSPGALPPLSPRGKGRFFLTYSAGRRTIFTKELPALSAPEHTEYIATWRF